MAIDKNIEGRLTLICDELANIRHAAYACSADNDTTEPLCNLIEQVQNLAAAVVSWVANAKPKADKDAIIARFKENCAKDPTHAKTVVNSLLEFANMTCLEMDEAFGYDTELWKCSKCGCYWRRNDDKSWSLADVDQKPCIECDNGNDFLKIIEYLGEDEEKAYRQSAKESQDGE